MVGDLKVLIGLELMYFFILVNFLCFIIILV